MTVDMGNALPVEGLKTYDVLTAMPSGFCSDRFDGALSSTYEHSSQSSGRDRMSKVREMGKVGEAAVGYEKNTQRIPSLTGTATYRVPDILTDSFVGEVKNYSHLVRLTNQIRDEMLYAEQEGLKFYLFTDAPLAPSLEKLHDNKFFFVKPIFKK